MSGNGDAYHDRLSWHKWMGPTESCDQCYGSGVVCDSSRYPEGDDYSYDEKYCDCPCGRLKKSLENGTPHRGPAMSTPPGW